MRKCIKCGLEKLLSDFHKHSAKSIRHVCKSCWRIQTDTWTRNNKSRSLANWKKWRDTHKPQIKKYMEKYVDNLGGTQAYSKLKDKGRTSLRTKVLDILLPLQENKCAICNLIFDNRIRAYVDHDYETMKIRGILCPKCNVGVSFFEKWKDFSDKALNYLNNFPAKEIELPLYWYKNKSLK